MAKPFAIDSPFSNLSEPFPSPNELCAALENGTKLEREMFVRLWLSEGIPHAFRDRPAIFEKMRGWLGKRLDVHPKEITLIGSARIGYSLARGHNFGRPFSGNSDLDFSIISPPLFERLVEAFTLFSDDYKSGRIQPRKNNESNLWRENIKFFERNIPRGFLDSNKFPNLERYAVAQKINQSMYLVKRNLKTTVEAPKIRHASARVYRNWQSFVDQVSLNLRYALQAAQQEGL